MRHPASLPLDELMKQCEIERTRRSGPGGQHRNKVETAVVIMHLPTGVRAEASERRSQAENLSRALFRLRVKLALAIRTPPSDSPSELWQGRIAGRRLVVNPEHDDFPALLAEGLDMLAAHEWTPADAGPRLGVSGSQVVKLVKAEPDALSLVNAERRSIGLPACR